MSASKNSDVLVYIPCHTDFVEAISQAKRLREDFQIYSNTTDAQFKKLIIVVSVNSYVPNIAEAELARSICDEVIYFGDVLLADVNISQGFLIALRRQPEIFWMLSTNDLLRPGALSRVLSEFEIDPTLDIVAQQEILSSINRDQIVLAFTGLSVDRMHDDFDKILLFDKILVGGMDTRLFKLRMQSGLFYTIGGSLLFGSTEQPGMIFIKTIVSNDRVDEAQAAILQVLDEAIDTITQEELDSAKRSIITAFDKGYELNSNKVATFSMLKKYNLPFNHYEQRAQALQNIIRYRPNDDHCPQRRCSLSTHQHFHKWPQRY